MRREAPRLQRERGEGNRGMRPVSDCCAASLRIAGRVLTYYVCGECGEACEADPAEDSSSSPSLPLR